MTTEEIFEREDMEITINELEDENANLQDQISKLESFYDKIETQKLSIIYQFNSWIIKDDIGYLAIDKTLMGALKKL